MSRKPKVPLPETDDPYVLLEVGAGASTDQIRRAYLRKVKVYKPDRHPAEFRRVREAYDRLREQEAWFDAWQSAGDVIKQAVEETDADAGDEAPQEDGGREVAEVDEAAERFERLGEAVHARLEAGNTAAAAELLLGFDMEPMAAHEDFGSLLLEVCCAAAWLDPPRFDALAARFGDLVNALDTEFREGALLHRRTLGDERSAWCEAVQGWPELERFVTLGSSLRAPAEAELGLRLGKRAANEPGAWLEVLRRAARSAPGIVALYVGMAERWARHYGRPLPSSGPRQVPTVDQAAEALALTVLTHPRVRWEQLRPVLVAAGMTIVVMLSGSALLELLLIGLSLALWGWKAWATDPTERLYLRVVQPAAATWLWVTGTSPHDLAVALEARLPRSGSWSALLQPADPSEYPGMLSNDLTLLAFGVTAPMIPRLIAKRLT